MAWHSPLSTASHNGNPQQSPPMTLGDRIKRARETLGWDVPRLAKETGIPYSTLKGIEDGHQATSTKTPEIAAALGVSPLWLASGKGPRIYHAEGQRDVKSGAREMGTASQNDTLDALILSTAERWVRMEEGAGRVFQPVRRLQRLMEIVGMIEADGGALTPEHSQELIDAARRREWDGASPGGTDRG